LDGAGVVLTMFDARTRLAEQVVAEVRRHFDDKVFRSVIPRSVRLSEAPGFGRPITRYDPATRGAQAYRDLTREFLTRWIERSPAVAEEHRTIDLDAPATVDHGKETS
ncbi:MAG: ParA family protein, partial [Actinomycetota bacterium]